MGFGFAVAADHHDQLLGADIQAANIGVVHVVLLGLGWFRLPDPASSPVELVYAGCRANDASDSPRPWRRGRGAYLKPRLPIEDRASPLIGLPRNMGALCPMPLYHKYNIQAAEDTLSARNEFFRSPLKPKRTFRMHVLLFDWPQSVPQCEPARDDKSDENADHKK
jgi:hypothetical protein